MLYGGVQDCKRNKWLSFGLDLDHHADCPIGNEVISQQIMSRFWSEFQESSTMIKKQLIKILGDLDHHADSPNREYGAIWGWWAVLAKEVHACLYHICYQKALEP